MSTGTKDSTRHRDPQRRPKSPEESRPPWVKDLETDAVTDHGQTGVVGPHAGMEGGRRSGERKGKQERQTQKGEITLITHPSSLPPTKGTRFVLRERRRQIGVERSEGSCGRRKVDRRTLQL